jgi:hypothetical protein
LIQSIAISHPTSPFHSLPFLVAGFHYSASSLTQNSAAHLLRTSCLVFADDTLPALPVLLHPFPSLVSVTGCNGLASWTALAVQQQTVASLWEFLHLLHLLRTLHLSGISRPPVPSWRMPLTLLKPHRRAGAPTRLFSQPSLSHRQGQPGP